MPDPSAGHDGSADTTTVVPRRTPTSPSAARPAPVAPDRLPPRPVTRPPVDPRQADTFARPRGVSGSFAGGARRVDPRVVTAPPPAESLAQAFGRPEGLDGPTLQRDPRAVPTDDGDEAPDPGPWRDPDARAFLGAPALDTRADPDDADLPAAPRLGVRELLLGSRVRPRALLALGAVALVIGLLGGLVGRLTAEVSSALTDPSVTLAQPAADVPAPQTDVAAVARAVLPAVVSVETRSGDTGGTGSGVVIDGGGFIVTNNHVISQAATTPQGTTLDVVFSDGTRVPAQIVGRDTKTDLAVVRAQVDNPTVAQLGRTSDVGVGDPVIAVGSPLGLAGTVTTGIVSSVQRPVRLSGDGTDTDAVIDAIQTDAAINPGNSGGPLVDLAGRVVGLNSAIRTSGEQSTGSIGLGFAIPVDEVTRIAQELIRSGQVKHAELGVNARSVSDGSTDGAEVANVVADGPAAKAGIAEGDVVTRVGDRTVRSADELTVAVRRAGIGSTVPVTVVRSGRSVELQATLGSD